MVKKPVDYIDELYKQFPEFSKSELLDIINHGLKRYVWANRHGCDVNIFKKNGKLVQSTSSRTYKEDVFWHLVYTRWRMKERALYTFRKEEWDGYYYVGVNKQQHEKLKRQRGKDKTLRNVYLVKVKSELDHYPPSCSEFIWKIPMPTDLGWKLYKEKITGEFEFVRRNLYVKYHKPAQWRIEQGLPPIDDGTESADGCAKRHYHYQEWK